MKNGKDRLFLIGGVGSVLVIALSTILFLQPTFLFVNVLFRIFLYATLFFFFAVIIVDLIFLLPTIAGAIYIPSKEEKVKEIVAMAKVKKGDKAVDIGSGDGRIVIALARAGAEAHGYEINPFLIFKSRLNVLRAGLKGKAFIHWTNFWLKDFSEYDVVTLFGISYIMKDLEKKLQKELKPGAKVISNAFDFPTWKPESKHDEVYVYRR